MARKAPLVASDSSSSSGSDSDEEEGKTESTSSETVTKETITTGAGKETIRLTVDAKNERAVFTRCSFSHSKHSSCSVRCSVSKCFFRDRFSKLPPHFYNSTVSSSNFLFLPHVLLVPEFSDLRSDGMLCSRACSDGWNVLMDLRCFCLLVAFHRSLSNNCLVSSFRQGLIHTTTCTNPHR